MIVRYPEKVQVGKVIRQNVSLVDVMPTLLDLAGVTVPPDSDGRSLAPLLRGEESADRPAYAELLHPKSRTPLVRRVSMRDGRYKLIVNAPPLTPAEPATELYDVVEDPDERRNLAGEEPQQKESLARLLREQREVNEQAGFARFEAEHLQPEVRERLRALGYVE